MAEKLADFGIGVDVDLSGLQKFADAIADGKVGYEEFAEAVVKSSFKAEEAIEILSEKQEEFHKKAWDYENRSYEERSKYSEKAKNLGEVISKLSEKTKILNIRQKDFANTTKKVKNGVDGVTQSFTSYAKKAATILGHYIAIKKSFTAVMGFAKEGEELARMAQLSGTSAESIQKLGIALKNYGGSASSASSTLSKLNQQMEDLKFGKGGKLGQAAIRYGLNINASSPEQMLLNIAQRMEGLKPLQQLNLGRMLGLDNATILFLQKGVAGVRKELEEAGKLTVFSDKDIRNSEKMQRAYREFQERLNQLKFSLSRGLIPVLEILFKKLSKVVEYLKEHPKIIKGVIVVLSLLSASYTAVKLGKFLTNIVKITSAFGAQAKTLLPYIAAILVLVAAYKAASYAAEKFFNILNSKKLADYHKKLDEDTANLQSLSDEEKDQIIHGNKTIGEVLANRRSSIEIGQSYVTTADTTPLNSMTSTQMTMMNSSANNQSTIWNVGSVTVNQKNNESSFQTMNDWASQFSTAQI